MRMNNALFDGDHVEVTRLGAWLSQLLDYVVAEFVIKKRYWDSAMDRLGGVASGTLQTCLRCRGPYVHANPEDVRQLRRWLRDHSTQLVEQDRKLAKS
jgi:hypothetical protein